MNTSLDMEQNYDQVKENLALLFFSDLLTVCEDHSYPVSGSPFDVLSASEFLYNWSCLEKSFVTCLLCSALLH